jgi:cytoskeletal protein CcmA (bactofilin family)
MNPSPGAAPIAVRPAGSPFERSATDSGTSVIGTDVHGDIHGRQVVIGEEGSVIGTVNADAIEVRGGVKGAIKAATVTLHPTAQVEGDITHQTLAISEGAQFDGRVRRAKDPADLKPNLDVSGFETIRMQALTNGG